jgi:tRNA-Thr(GGU) m(6)t(6)A37 methyltransferase TsaA
MPESSHDLVPIGFVRSPRTEVADDFWDAVESEIELCAEVPAESLDGLEEFSHAEIIYVFDRVTPDQITLDARRPRNNPVWPRVGIFAQRAKGRPNRLGSTIVRIVGREGRRLRVLALDAVDGTPVLDIKPVMAEFLPREAIRQPAWSRELMRDTGDLNRSRRNASGLFHAERWLYYGVLIIILPRSRFNRIADNVEPDQVFPSRARSDQATLGNAAIHRIDEH